MSLLSFLGPATTAATQAASGALAGQEQGRERQNATMMQMIAQLRAQHEQELKDQLTTADTNLKNTQIAAGGFRPNATPQPSVHQLDDGTLVQIGADGKARRVQMADQPGTQPASQPGSPATPPNPEDTQLGVSAPQAPQAPAQGTPQGTPPSAVKGPPKAPVMGSPEWLKAQADLEGIKAKDHFVFPTGLDAEGKPVVLRGNTATGELAPTDVAAKAGGAGAGGQTRLPERTQQLGLALQNAASVLPIHQSFATDAPGLFAGMGGAMAQEGGAKGQAANWALNKSGNDKYNQYLNGMDGLLLAVAHSVGGARINKEQIHMFGQNMVEGGGDSPEQNAQKLKAVIGFMNSARSTLPPDAVAQQEAQIGGRELAYLRTLGYGGPPTKEGLALVAQVKELAGASDAGNSASVGDRVSTVRAALQKGTVKQSDVLNSTKLTPAEKRAILAPQP